MKRQHPDIERFIHSGDIAEFDVVQNITDELNAIPPGEGVTSEHIRVLRVLMLAERFLLSVNNNVGVAKEMLDELATDPNWKERHKIG